jgi:hypothetical protein
LFVWAIVISFKVAPSFDGTEHRDHSKHI